MGLLADLGIVSAFGTAIVAIYQKQQKQMEDMNRTCETQRDADALVIQGLNKAITRLSESVGYLKGLLAGMGHPTTDVEAPKNAP